MRDMKRFLLLLCRLLLIFGIIPWLWLLWQHPDPDLVVLPAGVIFMGLSFHSILFRMNNSWERRYALWMTSRVGLGLLLIVVTYHLIHFAMNLATTFPDAPTSPSFSEQLVQGISTGAYWFFAVLVAVLALLRLPWVEEQWLKARIGEGASE